MNSHIKMYSIFLLSALTYVSSVTAERLELSGWEKISFAGKTEITATKSQIHIVSNDSATAYYYKFPEPLRSPFSLSWRWRVSEFTDSNPEDKEHDDYAARVYVVFDNFWNSRALNYVAIDSLSDKKSWVNPFSSNSLMIPRKVVIGDKWQQESALPWEDYARLFGREPTQVLGIAVMSDTDNTHGAVEAWYKDIEIDY